MTNPNDSNKPATKPVVENQKEQAIGPDNLTDADLLHNLAQQGGVKVWGQEVKPRTRADLKDRGELITGIDGPGC